MDTSALRVLCTAHGRADREGGWLRLVYSGGQGLSLTVDDLGVLLALDFGLLRP
jgi:hypothetical protein